MYSDNSRNFGDLLANAVLCNLIPRSCSCRVCVKCPRHLHQLYAVPCYGVCGHLILRYQTRKTTLSAVCPYACCLHPALLCPAVDCVSVSPPAKGINKPPTRRSGLARHIPTCTRESVRPYAFMPRLSSASTTRCSVAQHQTLRVVSQAIGDLLVMGQFIDASLYFKAGLGVLDRMLEPARRKDLEIGEGVRVHQTTPAKFELFHGYCTRPFSSH